MENGKRTKIRCALRWLNIALPAVTTLIGALVWRALPGRIPVHFGLNGQADRWADRGVGTFLLFFLLPWVLTLALFGAAWFIRWSFRHPCFANRPGRKAFFDLPPERQAEFREDVVEYLFAVGAASNLLVATALLAILAIARGQLAALPLWGIWPGLAVVVAVLVGYTFWLLRKTAGLRKR